MLIRINMKNLNILNKIYLIILSLLVLFTAYSIVSYNAWSRYYYTASLSAPGEFPVHARGSYFITDGREKVYITDNTVNNGRTTWGEKDIYAPMEKRLLPEKLLLNYASYRDKSFYKDTISLPVKLIKDIFKNESANQESGAESVDYNTGVKFDFIVGLANGGNVIVWLRANNKETVLLKHSIKASKPVGNDTYYEKRLSPNEYFKKVFSIDEQEQAQFDKERGKVVNYIDTPSGWGAKNRQLNLPGSE